MTTATITSAQWEAFADATLDHDKDAARTMGRELAAATLPVALAKRARHRKPNRRRSVITAVAGSLLLAAAIFASIATAAVMPAHRAPAFYGMTPGQVSQVATTLQAPGYQLAAGVTGTPAQEAAACSAVYHFHHENATDYGGVHARATERAWYHAWHLAGYADTMPGDSMRWNIRRYLQSGRGWSHVAHDCNPDA